MDWMSPWSLFAAILDGAIGLAYFVYGKKAERYLFMLVGLVIMALPFFFRTAVTLCVASAVGAILPFILIRLGIDF